METLSFMRDRENRSAHVQRNYQKYLEAKHKRK